MTNLIMQIIVVGVIGYYVIAVIMCLEWVIVEGYCALVKYIAKEKGK